MAINRPHATLKETSFQGNRTYTALRRSAKSPSPPAQPPTSMKRHSCTAPDDLVELIPRRTNVGAKAKTPPFARAFVNLAAPTEAIRPAGSTLRHLHYETKAYDDVAPSHVLTRP
jgi:hypothetical protein